MSKNNLSQKIISWQMYLLGFSLWMPSVSLLTIGDSWGLQIAASISFVLFIQVLCIAIIRARNFPRINIYRKFLLSHTVFIISIVLCTLFSFVGIDRSIKTLAVEALGAIFSFTLSWWFCRDIMYLTFFINGFTVAGLLSSIYAIYQLIGLRFGLPFAYIPVSNASFSTLNMADSQAMLRAFALTPEPSILASLLWVVIGIYTSKVFIYGGIKHYLALALVSLGLLATSSQSLAIVLFYIIFIMIVTNYFSLSQRKLKLPDLLGLCVLGISTFFIIITNDSIILWLSRISDSENNISAIMRLNEVLVGLEMFMQSPLTGWGLGSVSELMEAFTTQVGISLSAAGISSGLLRILAEQGLVGLSSMFLSLVCITPLRLSRPKSQEFSMILSYQVSFVISALVSLALFIGYRNLYHLWLVLPMGLSFNSLLTTVRSVERRIELENIVN